MKTNLLNFAVGPVMSTDDVRAIGGEQVPYFRTSEFSEVMFQNEQLMLQFAGAPEGSRAAFITGSGTASMEAAVINVLTPADKALVVNGGSFGQRFVELCEVHRIPHTEIRLNHGQSLTARHLEPHRGQGYTALLVNLHETSTGVLYDIDLIGDFCREEKMLLIVDTISAFLVDRFDMADVGADVMITGSQKALACQPGISVILLSPRAQERVAQSETRCMYLDLKDALRNGQRGQTPFTPAVTILLQINRRLLDIQRQGGAQAEIDRVHRLALDFREKIRIHGMPFEMFAASPSNGVTALHPVNTPAFDIFTTLKDEYGIWICPNGGELRDTIFRVGHMGALTPDDNDTLISAMRDMMKRGLIK